jgi:hypothetical protein
MGWVRSFRNNQFIGLNDGSTNSNLQVVVELGKFEDALLKRFTTSAAPESNRHTHSLTRERSKMGIESKTNRSTG